MPIMLGSSRHWVGTQTLRARADGSGGGAFPFRGDSRLVHTYGTSFLGHPRMRGVSCLCCLAGGKCLSLSLSQVQRWVETQSQRHLKGDLGPGAPSSVLSQLCVPFRCYCSERIQGGFGTSCILASATLCGTKWGSLWLEEEKVEDRRGRW